jgi:hypothetical protein
LPLFPGASAFFLSAAKFILTPSPLVLLTSSPFIIRLSHGRTQVAYSIIFLFGRIGLCRRQPAPSLVLLSFALFFESALLFNFTSLVPIPPLPNRIILLLRRQGTYPALVLLSFALFFTASLLLSYALLLFTASPFLFRSPLLLCTLLFLFLPLNLALLIIRLPALLLLSLPVVSASLLSGLPTLLLFLIVVLTSLPLRLRLLFLVFLLPIFLSLLPVRTPLRVHHRSRAKHWHSSKD